MMARRKINLNELSAKTKISVTNLSILKTNKAKAVRFSTLEQICKALNCQPGDILEFSDTSAKGEEPGEYEEGGGEN
jgi:putative transcriptional regulator